MSLDHLKLRIEFGGGLELLFSNQRTHDISLPSRVYPASNSPLEAKNAQDFGELDGRPADMKFLLSWLKANLLKEREELFLDGNTVRPGILVLINDTDWELEGECDYILKDRDEIVLISTLHGG